MKTGYAVLGVVLAGGVAHAALVTMSADMTTDSNFTAYISSDIGIAGDEFLSGDDWGTTHYGYYDFEQAGTYYLNIHAMGTPDREMFIGQFSFLSDDAHWDNGSRHLLTNASNDLWTVSTVGFGESDVGVVDLGDNGADPWGDTSGVWVARYMWAEGAPGEAFFTATITVVPAPASAALLGLGGLVAVRRRR